MSELIRGAGGGGGGGGGGKGGDSGGGGSQRTPTEAANSLFSTSYAKLIDLISEGEISGLVDGLKSIYIDNTPLQNADDSYNFQNVSVYTRNGTQSQSYIPGFDDVANEVSVGVTVQQASPVVRTITNSAINAARLTITVPQLQQYTDQGDINGTSVNLQIAVQYNGGGFTTVIDDTISGRTGQQYQKQYLVNLSGAFPIDIKVTRVTADSSSSKLVNAFSWSSFTEVTYAKLAYPNSGLVGVRIDAEQFNSIPSRSYRVRGIKVKIPSNGTVNSTTGAISYSGIWDGTFGAAQWTSDPAWCLWDLLTARYGFKDHIDTTQLDRWAFYSASQYCGASVPDGFGGFEPRFSCNVNIQTADDAYKLINDMASVFRAMPYWSTGALTVSQDKPADSAYLFTYANVSEEGFSYSGSSLKTRPTVAVVQYMDLSLRNTAYEVVENQAAISKYGVIKTDITAFACTSRGQAHRIGEWLLYSSQYETETVTFMASIDAGVLVRPGQIIEISDPVRAGARRGGRIHSATTTAITVDDATGLSITNTPSLSVILSNGTVQASPVLSVVGNVITVATAFSSAPNPNSVWIYETNNIQTTTWRVLGIQEQDQFKYAITALAYNASKYDYIERGVTLQARTVSNLNVIPAAPTNLTAQEVLYEATGRAASKIIISWQPVAGVTQYQIRWRLVNNNWTTLTLQRCDYEIIDTIPGVYEIEVYSLNTALNTSVQPAKLNFSAAGKTAPPTTVSGLSLIPIDNASAILSWDRSIELDVLLGGKVLIRHSVALTGAIWEESQEIVAAAAGSQTQKQVPLLQGSYLVKFEDDGGNRSLAATAVVVNLPAPLPRYLVTTYAEDTETPPFSGNYTDMFYATAADVPGPGIIISTGSAIDSWGLVDSLASIDSIGGVLSAGEYEFGSTYDMGGIFDVNISRRFVTAPYIPGELIDDYTLDIDSWGYIDGTTADRVNAALYVRTTQDDPTGAPAWSAWREFSNAIVRGRGYQFKTIATSDDPTQNIVIKELGVNMELQQRTEQSATLTSGAGTYSVTFANAFYQAPSIGVTGFNMGTGDYFTVASVTASGFQLTFRNSAGTAVSRTFTYTAIGYGRQV